MQRSVKARLREDVRGQKTEKDTYCRASTLRRQKAFSIAKSTLALDFVSAFMKKEVGRRVEAFGSYNFARK